MRFPFYHLIEEDEVFYSVVAREWLLGNLPYVAMFDVKPPGLFASVAAAQQVFGINITSLKILEWICVSFSSLGLFLIGQKYLGRAIGLWSLLLYPIYSITLGGISSPASLIQAPLEIFAILSILAIPSRRDSGSWHSFMAGLLFGVALTIKQTAIFDAILLFFYMIVRSRSSTPNFGYGWLTFVCGLILPSAMFGLYYFAHGHFLDLISAVVGAASGRLKGDNVTFLQGIEGFLPNLKPAMILLVTVVLVLTRSRKLIDQQVAESVSLILVWLAGDVVGVLAGRSMYSHYFLMLIPQSILLSGVFVFYLSEISTTSKTKTRIIFIGAAFVAAIANPLIYQYYLFRSRTTWYIDLEAVHHAETSLLAAGLKPRDPILVLNRGLLVYLDTNTRPSGFYFYPQHLLCDFPAETADPLADALSGAPKFVVVADLREAMVCERKDRHTEAAAALKLHWDHIGKVSGPEDAFDLYEARR